MAYIESKNRNGLTNDTRNTYWRKVSGELEWTVVVGKKGILKVGYYFLRGLISSP